MTFFSPHVSNAYFGSVARDVLTLLTPACFELFFSSTLNYLLLEFSLPTFCYSPEFAIVPQPITRGEIFTLHNQTGIHHDITICFVAAIAKILLKTTPKFQNNAPIPEP
eukprot:gnl/Ergobibamus_cyprinoides/4012.p2 GENE.gnl/Ergobibamus_cyprinoides/4012~~gnl/Ergobibamus_cyprinoides/4012.p2  ORF type:complete len:109 (+),score=24.75 gnl/Ergobibamus_cyprinoides/4012:117-443(+)